MFIKCPTVASSLGCNYVKCRRTSSNSFQINLAQRSLGLALGAQVCGHRVTFPGQLLFAVTLLPRPGTPESPARTSSQMPRSFRDSLHQMRKQFHEFVAQELSHDWWGEGNQ